MEEAKKAASYLLEKKLIACANYFPIKSSSCWTGKIAECDEVVSIVKTKKENWEELKKEVKKLHSYEVPCIIKIDVEANEEYENWINSGLE